MSPAKPNPVIISAHDTGSGTARNAPGFPFLHMRECRLLTEVGRARDAINSCERTLALRPFAAPTGHRHAFAMYVAGQARLALREVPAALASGAGMSASAIRSH